MKKILFFALMLIGLGACSSEPKSIERTAEGTDVNTAPVAVNVTELKSDIEALKTFFASQKDGKLDKNKANEMVEKSQQFAKAFPNDSIGAGYLFIGGEVARSLGQYEDAISMFSTIETDYPNHEKAAQALFLKGFTYEENLRNKELAKRYYQEFLEKYPKHELAGQVKQLLAVVDLTPEELVKRFQEQNKK